MSGLLEQCPKYIVEVKYPNSTASGEACHANVVVSASPAAANLDTYRTHSARSALRIPGIPARNRRDRATARPSGRSIMHRFLGGNPNPYPLSQERERGAHCTIH